MTVERIAGLPSATYSDAVSVSGAGRWVFISGQLPVDASGRVVGATLAEQAEACIDRIEEVARRAGGGLEDVVQIRTYVVDLADYGEFASVRGARFGDRPPSSAAVGVAGLLGGARIEIEAVAFIGES